MFSLCFSLMSLPLYCDCLALKFHCNSLCIALLFLCYCFIWIACWLQQYFSLFIYFIPCFFVTEIIDYLTHHIQHQLQQHHITWRILYFHGEVCLCFCFASELLCIQWKFFKFKLFSIISKNDFFHSHSFHSLHHPIFILSFNLIWFQLISTHFIIFHALWSIIMFSIQMSTQTNCRIENWKLKMLNVEFKLKRKLFLMIKQISQIEKFELTI